MLIYIKFGGALFKNKKKSLSLHHKYEKKLQTVLNGLILGKTTNTKSCPSVEFIEAK